MKIKIRKQIAIIGLIILIIGIGISLFALSQRQDIRQRAACLAESAVCSWDPVESATTYHYKVTSNEEIIKEGDINAPTSRVTFTPIAGNTYTCTVYAVNNCGAIGPEGEGSATCNTSDTPTPSLTTAPTPTNVPTVTPIVTEIPTPTQLTPIPSPTEVVTPQPSNTPTNTPVPTNPPVATNTPVPTNTITTIDSPTPTPGIPPTGSDTFNIGIVLGTLIILLGTAVFFVL